MYFKHSVEGSAHVINHTAFSEWLVNPPSFSQTQSQRGTVVFGKQPNIHAPTPPPKLGADLKNIFFVCEFKSVV